MSGRKEWEGLTTLLIEAMPQAGKNKGKRNAALKPGEVGRVQWTQSLDRNESALYKEHLIKLGIINEEMDRETVKAKIVDFARQLCIECLQQVK